MTFLRTCVLAVLLVLAPLAGYWHALSHIASGHGESAARAAPSALDPSPVVSMGSEDSPASPSGCPGCGAWGQFSGAIPSVFGLLTDSADPVAAAPQGATAIVLAAAPAPYSSRAPPRS